MHREQVILAYDKWDELDFISLELTNWISKVEVIWFVGVWKYDRGFTRRNEVVHH